jgi:hypothetical protein
MADEVRQLDCPKLNGSIVILRRYVEEPVNVLWGTLCHSREITAVRYTEQLAPYESPHFFSETSCSGLLEVQSDSTMNRSFCIEILKDTS